MDVATDSWPPSGPLSDVRVMIVEDDNLQASIVAMTLEESGAIVLGPVTNLEDARGLLDVVPPDCVVLDVRLRDDYAFSLADELQRRGIPTVLATGYDASTFPSGTEPHTFLSKPFSDAELLEAVVTTLSSRPAGPALSVW